MAAICSFCLLMVLNILSIAGFTPEDLSRVSELRS